MSFAEIVPDADFWDHQVRNVCIFPDQTFHDLPEWGHSTIRQQIVYKSGCFYFYQWKEIRDYWSDSTEETLLQLPEDFPAGWTADRLIDGLLQTKGVDSREAKHLRFSSLLQYLLQHITDDKFVFLDTPALGGVLARTDQNYHRKHLYATPEYAIEITLRIHSNALVPQQQSPVNVLHSTLCDPFEMKRLTSELPPEALLTEISIDECLNAFLCFDCPQDFSSRSIFLNWDPDCGSSDYIGTDKEKAAHPGSTVR